MNLPVIDYCPGTLAEGYTTYSPTCLRRVFNGKKVSHILPYPSPASGNAVDIFLENRRRISISGVQEKFSVVLEKNKLRLTHAGEKSTYILKPVPASVGNREQLPANEHLTIQIARQIYDIETAENALIFFSDGEPAYITRRFDVTQDGGKLAMEDFASLSGKTPQTDGEHYKYLGNYAELFDVLKKYVPAYPVEALKLFKLTLFNYFFSNGDAHLKNFSVLETEQGDFRLAPAYDLLDTKIHVGEDSPFALVDGLLPFNSEAGNIPGQFKILADLAEIKPNQYKSIINTVTSGKEKVFALIQQSFLDNTTKQQYFENFLSKLNKFIQE